MFLSKPSHVASYIRPCVYRVSFALQDTRATVSTHDKVSALAESERVIQQSTVCTKKEIPTSSSGSVARTMEADVNIVGGASTSQIPIEQSSATGTDFYHANQQSFSSETDGSVAHKHPYGSQRNDKTLHQHLEATHLADQLTPSCDY